MKTFNWNFPPTMNKHGKTRNQYDTKTVHVVLEPAFFDQPVIAMSDIHCQTKDLLEKLVEYVHLDQFVVLTCGDMAGGHTMGTDGDPTEFYEFLAKQSKEFYFVQGNHDDYNPRQKTILNAQNKLAGIKDGIVVKSLIGTIGGVNGIISDKVHPFKMSSHLYIEHLKKTLAKKPKILLTHDTPAIVIDKETKRIGNDLLFETIHKGKPKIHFYGHCHHQTPMVTLNGTTYVCLDSRVIIFVPKNTLATLLFKKDLENSNYDCSS